MVASRSVHIPKKSQEQFIAYYDSIQDLQNTFRDTLRARLEGIDKAYQREVDQTKEQADAKNANKQGDPNRYQNMVVPVVMPQVEAAVAYQTSVYLTGEPIFGMVADPKYIDEAKQMETVLSQNSTKGAWPRELMLFFRDGFKYNFAPVEVSWAEEVTYSVATDITKSTSNGIPKEVIWSGNKLRRLDPYNTILDPRVPPTEVYKKGEFAGWTEPMTRIQLKSFVASLPDTLTMNIRPAFESGIGTIAASVNSSSKGVYYPSINPEVNRQETAAGGHDWLKWARLGSSSNQRIEYKDMYEVTTLYCKVLPSEFDLKVSNRDTPQIYKLVIVNHEHIIYMEQQTNAHSYLPILVGAPLEDGLGYQTKSLATNAMPFQDLATSYMTSIISSRRRAISDRVLYDPSRISAAQINSPNPSAKMPVRPSAYGKTISDSVYAFPYREDQAASSMQQISAILGMSNQLSGQNQASQGQFVKGNKTLHEFESVMQNANSRDQMASILLEFQVFIPLKEIVKLDILQYQGGTTVFNRDSEQSVEIDPVQLRKAVLEFKVSDGLTPASKLINGESLKMALQVLGSSPQIAQGYNLAQLFSYLMKTQGAKIDPFEKSPEQQAFEQAVSSWQQLAIAAMENGVDPEKLPDQPVPADFGYDPAANKPAPEGTGGGQARSTAAAGLAPGNQAALPTPGST